MLLLRLLLCCGCAALVCGTFSTTTELDPDYMVKHLLRLHELKEDHAESIRDWDSISLIAVTTSRSHVLPRLLIGHDSDDLSVDDFPPTLHPYLQLKRIIHSFPFPASSSSSSSSSSPLDPTPVLLESSGEADQTYGGVVVEPPVDRGSPAAAAAAAAAGPVVSAAEEGSEPDSEAAASQPGKLNLSPGMRVGRCDSPAGDQASAALFLQGEEQRYLLTDAVVSQSPAGVCVGGAFPSSDAFGDGVVVSGLNPAADLVAPVHADIGLVLLRPTTATSHKSVNASCVPLKPTAGCSAFLANDATTWMEHVLHHTPVRKYGAKTGLTEGTIVGYGDRCRQFVRLNYQSRTTFKCISWEANSYLIQNANPFDLFAEREDSGSALVQQSDCRVVGLIHSRHVVNPPTAPQSEAPFSYAYPIEDVLRVINTSAQLDDLPLRICNLETSSSSTYPASDM